jgi:CelD/BcsL family acetyltransferase involved in cellulose biosynthesis
VEQTRCEDLRATVSTGGVPDGALDGLPHLYSSIFATRDWWESQDKKTATGCCILDHPRHILAFCVEDDTVQILNKVFAIGPQDTERACRSIFQAVPSARRIRMEVLYPPRRLALPVRTVAAADHMVIDLPGTVAEYDASLGKRTRGNLRNFQNRLRRDFPDVRTDVVPAGERTEELLAQLIEWKNDWFRAQGRQSFWEELPQQQDLYLTLLKRSSEARVTTLAGAPAAIRFMCPVGRATVSLQGAFDPAYRAYRLGLLSSYWAICDAIERGMSQVNLLWGTTGYKAHLGATPRTAYQISVFRSQTARLHSLDEAAAVARRRIRRTGSRLYWDSRHRARRTLEKAGLRATPGET